MSVGQEISVVSQPPLLGPHYSMLLAAAAAHGSSQRILVQAHAHQQFGELTALQVKSGSVSL